MEHHENKKCLQGQSQSGVGLSVAGGAEESGEGKWRQLYMSNNEKVKQFFGSLHFVALTGSSLS